MAVMLTCVPMWLGRRVEARTTCLSFQIGQIKLYVHTFTVPPLLPLLAAILDLSVTTTPMLPFGACYVIMHKVYFLGQDILHSVSVSIQSLKWVVNVFRAGALFLLFVLS